MVFIVVIIFAVFAIAFLRWLFTGIIPETWFRSVGRTVDWTLRIGVFALIGFFVYIGYFLQAMRRTGDSYIAITACLQLLIRDS